MLFENKSPRFMFRLGLGLQAFGVLTIAIAFIFFAPGCHAPSDLEDRVISATDCDTVFVEPPEPDVGVGSSSESSSTGGEEACPDMRGGVAHTEGSAVTFCPAELGGTICRDVLVVNAANALSTGPLHTQWHGTYENPDGYLSWDFATGSLRSMVVAESGLLVLPYADPQAVGRPSGAFPWWIVGNSGNPAMQTDRLDDFVLFDNVVRCALEQGLGSPDRVTISGMSAGGIMVTHLVDRHDPVVAGYQIAAAVSWSGGLPPDYQPASPTGNVPMMLTQGGTNDVYCGPGQPAGGCGGYEPYSFVQPTEHFATAVDADAYAFVCRHPWGHGSFFGPTAADFVRLARANMTHPWQPYTSTHNDWSIAYCGEALP